MAVDVGNVSDSCDILQSARSQFIAIVDINSMLVLINKVGKSFNVKLYMILNINERNVQINNSFSYIKIVHLQSHSAAKWLT